MKSILAPLLLAALLSSCASAPTVSTDHDPAANFAGYHGYFWLKQPEGLNPLAGQRIVSGVDAHLAAKGWQQVPQDQADVAVVANVASHEEHDLDTMYTGMGGWGYGGWYGAVYSPGYLVNTTVVRLQTRVWGTEGEGKPLWTGVSESVDPSEVKSLSKEISFMVTKELDKHGLI